MDRARAVILFPTIVLRILKYKLTMSP